MKKLYLLLLALVCSVGMSWGVEATLFTTNFSTADGWSTESIITSTTTSATKTINGTTISFKGYKNSDLTVEVGAENTADGTLTFTGNNLLASAGAATGANYYMAIPVSGVNGQLTVTTTGDATKWYYTYDDGNTGNVVARLQAAANRTFTINNLTSTNVTVYIGGSGKKMNSITITTPLTHTVSFAAGAATGTMDPVVVEEGTLYTIPECTFTAPANNVFDGWSDGVNTYAEGETFTMPDHDVTLTAQWYDLGNNVTLYVHPMNLWTTTPKVYAWNGGNNNGWNSDANTMTADGIWYKMTIDKSVYNTVIVHNNGDNQANDLDISGLTPGDYYYAYYADGGLEPTTEDGIKTNTVGLKHPGWDGLSNFRLWVAADNHGWEVNMSEDAGWYTALVEHLNDSYTAYIKFQQYSDNWENAQSDKTTDIYAWNVAYSSGSDPKNYTVTTRATKPNGNTGLAEVEFSNSFLGFVKGYNIYAYYMEDEAAPTVVDATCSANTSTYVLGADAEGVTLTVTAEDGSDYLYHVKTVAVAPTNIAANQLWLGASDAWVKTGSAFSDTKGWVFSKAVEEESNKRISEGKSRLYFFVGPATEFTLINTGIGSDRNIKVFVNGVEQNGITKIGKSSGSNSISITGLSATGNNMVAIISNQTGGDGGFTKYTLTPVAPLTPSLTLAATDGADYYATFSCANAVEFDDATVYTVEVNAGVMTLTEVASKQVPANAGVLVKSASATATYSFIASASALEHNMLRAASVAKEATGFVFYKLAYASDEKDALGFYYGAADGAAFTSRANSAYLAVPASAGAPAHFLFEDSADVATSVENTEIGEDVVKLIENGQLMIIKNGVRYNALGQLVR